MSLFQSRKIYMSGSQKTTLDQARGRLVLISAFFVFAYVIIVARSVDLSVIQGEMQRAEEISVYDSGKSVVEQETSRADIVDRNGVILARSLQVSSLYVDPLLVKKPTKLAKDIVEIFPELSYGKTLQKLQGKKRFAWIKRNINPEEQSKILYLGYPELGFKKEMQRVYPQGPLAVHMVGMTGIDGQGLSGIESSFDKLLNSSTESLRLTLDVRLQHALKREVEGAMIKHKAVGGAGLIMDVSNGEILSAVSLPDYDPHLHKKISSNKKFNKTTLGVYELGSSFKVFSTAAYLEHNSSGIVEKFDVREPIKVGRFQIRDYHPEDRVLTLPEVFIHSSNIGSALMGQEVGSKKLQDFYKDLGLLDTPDIEISEVGRPLVPNPWREVSTLTAAYGHGIAVSPLQLVRAASSIVNGGVLINPTIVMQKNSQKKVTKESALRIVSPQTSHRMRQLMRLTVTMGTGTKADVEGFLVGGKTGTAEKPGKGGYNRKNLISSFLGVFPMDAPRYAVFIMIDEPEGTKDTYGYATGGWVAAPAVGKVVSAMASIVGLKPKTKKKNFESDLWQHIATKEQLQKEQEIAAH